MSDLVQDNIPAMLQALGAMVGGPVSLDQLVHATRQAKDCGDLLTLLRKHEGVINSSHAGQLRGALQNLDPTANALAFIFML